MKGHPLIIKKHEDGNCSLHRIKNLPRVTEEKEKRH